jgi:hypothetical protein
MPLPAREPPCVPASLDVAYAMPQQACAIGHQLLAKCLRLQAASGCWVGLMMS